MAGRIEKVDAATAVFKLQHGRRHGNAPLFLQLHPVTGRAALRGTCRHASRQLQGTAVKQQLLGQSRLPRIGVRNDREGATARNFSGMGNRISRHGQTRAQGACPNALEQA